MYYRLNENISCIKVYSTYAILYIKTTRGEIPISKVNSTAFEILKLCNGKNTKAKIIDELSKKYEDVNQIKEFVTKYINASIKDFLIIEQESPFDKDTTNIAFLDFTELIIPELVAIELTKNCPLKCKHCYLNAGEGYDPNNNIETSTLNNIVNEIIELNIPSVQLTGGEPLLHKDIYKIIEVLQDKDISVQLFTSGYVNDDKTIKKLSSYKDKKFVIQVSVDGLAKYHNNFRGKNDAYEKTMLFIERSISEGLNLSVGISILDQKNEEIIDLVGILKNKGVSVVRLGYVSERGRAIESNIAINLSNVERIKKLQKTLQKIYADDTFRIQLTEDFDKVSVCGNCGLGQMILKIDYKGDIYPCVMSDIKIGNYLTSNIKDTQKRCSRIFSKIQLPQSEECRQCKKFNLCNYCIIEALMYCDNQKTWYKNNIPLIESVQCK